MKHFAWNDLRDIVTVQGRTWEHEDNLYFNWSSSGFTVRFRGSALLAEFSAQSSEEYDGIPGDPNTPHRTVWPWISVFVDDNDRVTGTRLEQILSKLSSHIRCNYNGIGR